MYIENKPFKNVIITPKKLSKVLTVSFSRLVIHLVLIIYIPSKIRINPTYEIDSITLKILKCEYFVILER